MLHEFLHPVCVSSHRQRIFNATISSSMASPYPAVVHVSVGSLVAEISLLSDLEQIIPPQFLPSTGDTTLNEFLPWIFTQVNIATNKSVDSWPKEEHVFHRLFRKLR